MAANVGAKASSYTPTSAEIVTALGYTPGISNFSGDYNDLANRPQILSSDGLDELDALKETLRLVVNRTFSGEDIGVLNSKLQNSA